MAELRRPAEERPRPWPLDAVLETRESVLDLINRIEAGSVVAHTADVDSVQRAFDGIDLARSLFTELRDTAGIPPVAPHNCAAEVDAIVDRLRRLRVVVDAVCTAGSVRKRFRAEIDEVSVFLDDKLLILLQQFREVIADSDVDGLLTGAAMPIADRYLDRIEARRLVGETEAARDAAVDALRTTRRVAGITGETKLAQHFGDYASRERRSANRLRAACIATLFAVALGAGALIYSAGGSLTTAEEIARLSLTIPVVALAAYLGREASRHRLAAQWASELEVQLLTVDAYTEALSDDLREQIRAELGRRVFSSGQVVAPSNSPSAVSDTAAVIERAADLVRSAAGSSTARG